VRLKEGETTTIASFLAPQQSTTLSGLPGIAGLPGLGWLAQDQTKADQDTELMILVTPRMVRYAPRQDRTIYAGQGELQGPGLTPGELPAAIPQPGQPAQPIQPQPGVQQPGGPVPPGAQPQPGAAPPGAQQPVVVPGQPQPTEGPVQQQPGQEPANAPQQPANAPQQQGNTPPGPGDQTSPTPNGNAPLVE
jgi:hypothetical protein